MGWSAMLSVEGETRQWAMGFTSQLSYNRMTKCVSEK